MLRTRLDNSYCSRSRISTTGFNLLHQLDVTEPIIWLDFRFSERDNIIDLSRCMPPRNIHHCCEPPLIHPWIGYVHAVLSIISSRIWYRPRLHLRLDFKIHCRICHNFHLCCRDQGSRATSKSRRDSPRRISRVRFQNIWNTYLLYPHPEQSRTVEHHFAARSVRTPHWGCFNIW